MKTVEAHFLVGNTLVGSGPLPQVSYIRLGQQSATANAAYFCPACGEIWGRIVVAERQDYLLRHRFCFHHGSGLFQDSHDPIWEHYPKEVLRREISLIAKHIATNPSLSINELLINWKRYYV